MFVPSHAAPTRNIPPLVALNLKKQAEIIPLLQQACAVALCFEAILQTVFTHYSLHMNFNPYVLVGRTLRSSLSYLHDKGSLTAAFTETKLL